MSLYTHLTINEREQIFLLSAQGHSIRAIAKKVERSPSTISRELARNQDERNYSPSTAQDNYTKRKTNCGRKRLLDNAELKALVKKLFLHESGHENRSPIAFSSRKPLLRLVLLP